MNGTRAKLIRRIANEIATKAAIPAETAYKDEGGNKIFTGQLTVDYCERMVVNQVKKLHRVAKNFPARLFHTLAIQAIRIN